MRFFLGLLFFLLPLVWSRYVNANYLTTKTFFLYFVTGLSLMALPRRLSLKKVPIDLVAMMVAVFTYYIVYHSLEESWFSFLSLFKMLSFCGLAFYFYCLNLDLKLLAQKKWWAFTAFISIVVSITLYQVIKFRFFEGNNQTIAIMSTFGNVNMFAEFMILFLPLLFIWMRSADPLPKLFKTVMFGSVIFLLLYTRSRSAWIGLFLWLAVVGIRRIHKGEWVAAGSALLLFLVSHFTAQNADDLNKFLPKSFETRSALYQAASNLLMDSPWGIPVGDFMNAIVPYLMKTQVPAPEFMYYDQPHSEFLKWGIQFGWVFLFLAILILARLFWICVSKFRETQRESHATAVYCLGFFLVLIPQITFQFPFENPASILIIAFSFGLFLSQFQTALVFKSVYIQWITGIIGIAFVVKGFLFITSVLIESHYNVSADVTNMACKYYPLNFKNCYYKNKALYDLKNIPAFREQYKNDFIKNPFFCDNLRLMPEYFNFAGNERRTCEAVLLYNLIFKDQKTYPIESNPVCKKYSTPVVFNDPKQFYIDVLSWFRSGP